MTTCGSCKHYADNTCYSLTTALSLFYDVYTTTPACEHFEQRKEQLAPAPVNAPGPVHKPPADPLAMLSQETRDKLARQETERTRQTFLPLRYMPGAADR